MNRTDIETLLKEAFEASTESRSLHAAWIDKGEQLEAVKSRSLEFGDKAAELLERIEAADAEIEELSPQNVDFETLSEKRKALRSMQADHDDILLWVDKLHFESKRLYSEHLELKRQLNEAVHAEVMNPCFLAAQDHFRKLISEAELLFDSWTAEWSSFRAQIGGDKTPRFTGRGPQTYDALEGMFS